MHWKGRRPEQRRDRREWVQCWAWVHGQVRVWRLLQSRLGIWHRLSLWHRDRGRLRRGHKLGKRSWSWRLGQSLRPPTRRGMIRLLWHKPRHPLWSHSRRRRWVDASWWIVRIPVPRRRHDRKMQATCS